MKEGRKFNLELVQKGLLFSEELLRAYLIIIHAELKALKNP